MEAFQSGFALGVLQELLDRFKACVVDEIGQTVKFDGEQELEKLVRKLVKAQVLLVSIQLDSSDAWQHWVGDLTRVCYDAEDLVDDIMLGPNKSSVLEKICSYFKKWSMPRKIQELETRLDDIVSGLDMLIKTRHHLHLPVGPITGCTQEHVLLGYGIEEHTSRRRVQALLPEKLFGRDQEKESIIKMLLKETVYAVSIVGIGGLGKTTLAQVIHKDSRIQAHFKHKVWVSVSAKFDLRKIADSILHSRNGSTYNNTIPDRIEGLFQDLYKGESILIVLDDLWDVKYNDWNSFCSLFLRSSGKVLLTSCNPNVALVTKAIPYYLQSMRDEDCRALILDRALSANNLSERELINLAEVAGAIAEKCKGLPLAAKTLGLLLSSKPGEDEWTTLSQRDICDLQVFREEVFPAFRLNNPDLAPHLKKCFAYCSLFPYNYEFKKNNLVQLWMSEGFIPCQGKTGPEEIGYDYFDELSWRSLFQLSHLDEKEVETYKMHEFIHRFAEFVASDTCFRLEEEKWSSCSVPWYKKARHLSLLCQSIQLLFLKNIEKCEGLRTFLVLHEHGTQIGQVPYSLFQKLLRLRVVDLSRTDIDELPESVGRLKHLRLLDLSETHIQKLPESTSDLHSLQILRLRNCFELLQLPKNTKKLTNLIHLDVDIKGLTRMPATIGSLIFLQTLYTFIAGKKEGNRVTELKNLNSLRGSICLSDLENVKDGSEAKEAMLCGKPFIKKLELEWSHYTRNRSIAMDVLAGFQPHKNLKEISIMNYGGSNFPDWITSPSCMLVSIHLQNCQQAEVLPPLGQLLFLKTLHVEGMHGVKYVDHHFCGTGTSKGFPSLESLKIQDTMCLTRWCTLPENSMNQLHDLTIEDCPNLLSVSSLNHMSSLFTLEINRCPGMKSLPQELPASLGSLIIIESDNVKQRCQPEEGPDWCIIKAIPHVEIDFTEISIPSSSS